MPKFSKKSFFLSYFNTLYLIGLFLIGMGYIFLFPVFEGFDENAHYSRIREVFETKKISDLNKSFLDENIVQYQGPIPFSSGEPPFDKHLVYQKFFKEPSLIKKYQEYYKNSPLPSYIKSKESNWEAQHPPLYYFLSASIMKLTYKLSFLNEFLILRIFSYLLALTGVLFSLLALQNLYGSKEQKNLRTGFLIYPILLPMFFIEFMRIGNDSLCLAFMGIFFYLITYWQQKTKNTASFIFMGIILGLGLLTKALFIPITLGVFLFLFIRLIIRENKISMLKKITSLAFIIILFGGGYYIYKFIFFSELGIGEESIQLNKQGGILLGLEKNFHLINFIRGSTVPLVSFIWAGSWSLVRLPIYLYLPLFIANGLAIFYFLKNFLKNLRRTDNFLLSFILFILMYLALLFHVLISMALSGLGTSGGWYLHVLMPFTAIAMGLGVKNFNKIALMLSFIYAIIFQIIAIIFHMALFSGLAFKNAHKEFVFNCSWFCFGEFPKMIDRISIINYPILAILFFISGFSILTYLAVKFIYGNVYEKNN